MKRAILPFLITLLISALVTYGLYKWISEFSIDPMVENQVSKGQIIKLAIICFIYFFGLITFPVLLKSLIQQFKLKEKDVWKMVIGFEMFFLVFSYLVTPPDLISTLLLFFFCQLIVLVNVLVVRRQLRQLKNQSLT